MTDEQREALRALFPVWQKAREAEGCGCLFCWERLLEQRFHIYDYNEESKA